MSGEFVMGHPFERSTPKGFGLTLHQATKKKLQMDHLLRISVRYLLEQRADFYLHAQFLL